MASEFTSYKSTVDTDFSVFAVCASQLMEIYMLLMTTMYLFYKTAIGTIFDN
jgi:hypothetical protein